jgi:hypothetical protein
MEEIYIKQLLGISILPSRIITAMPQHDCGYPRCAANRRRLILREEEMAPVVGDIVVLHGLITDLYDINRIVASINAPTKLLITAITARMYDISHLQCRLYRPANHTRQNDSSSAC